MNLMFTCIEKCKTVNGLCTAIGYSSVLNAILKHIHYIARFATHPRKCLNPCLNCSEFLQFWTPLWTY